MHTIANRFGEEVDVLGVGVGPFNLSVAALLDPIKTVKSYFFDRNDAFVWHSGMLFSDSEIQVSYLKDLVTLVDPTNPYSFLAYLSKHQRLYRFINARFSRVKRQEFNNYFRWVSQSLPSCHFGEKVESVDYSSTSKHFIMQTSRRVIKSKHLILGNGLTATVPSFVKSHLGEKVFHSKDFSSYKQQCVGKRVVIVGGGQSGAEIFNTLLKAESLPSKITWVTRREQFSPIDDSVFANELFTPQHSEVFYELPNDKKERLVKQHLLASDGVSSHLLESIYQRLYELEYLAGNGRFYQLLPNHGLQSLAHGQSAYRLNFNNKYSETAIELEADIVILCTGYQFNLPSYLSPILDHIELAQDKYIVNKDYSIQWDGPKENRIYVQNAARHSHGIADPNLSLMSWRSATIINSILGHQYYQLENNQDVLSWPDIYSSDQTQHYQEVDSYAEYAY